MNGLKINRQFHDDERESKSVEASANILETPPVQTPVLLRIGYLSEDCLNNCRCRVEHQMRSTADSMLFTITTLAEFKQAVIDGAISAEQCRIRGGRTPTLCSP